MTSCRPKVSATANPCQNSEGRTVKTSQHRISIVVTITLYASTVLVLISRSGFDGVWASRRELEEEVRNTSRASSMLGSRHRQPTGNAGASQDATLSTSHHSTATIATSPPIAATRVRCWP
ncbi:hypothetical protein GLAREA_07943 [Glarea lozoyensis ATCC 20868]|uniref:Uncharacterized protein n=1 Tax=Glarea lozoyensis (strain ATCC 20868 / MF5171) TaxID=1116229 RepID=S3DBQ8_GLAL2|nr:uncharacterized protein GLAREA_07943 [Glarea lozoyensis ATCC 20868]EPE24093.1 hypothetical protein GLAREA_07943 [Glarea lozoyensis ATCC 20868]